MNQELKIEWVRLLLTGTMSVHESLLLNIQIADALKLTDVYHIIAACQVLAKISGRPFSMPQIEEPQFKILCELMNKIPETKE